MAMFKVHFDNNQAVCGEMVPAIAQNELTKLEIQQSKTVLRWCVVDADHEAEAISVASEMAKIRWGNILK